MQGLYIYISSAQLQLHIHRALQYKKKNETQMHLMMLYEVIWGYDGKWIPFW